MGAALVVNLEIRHSPPSEAGPQRYPEMQIRQGLSVLRKDHHSAQVLVRALHIEYYRHTLVLGVQLR